MKFSYKARTKEGKIETGTIEASSKEAAVLILQKYNIFVTSLDEENKGALFAKKFSFSKKISKKDLSIFSRQLAVMLESRIPVIQSLTSLAAQIKKENFREEIIKISSMVEEGSPLSEAFSVFPNTFDDFFISLLKSGEASGKISETLYYLSDHLEREQDIASKVKQAMIYPIFTLAVLGAVMVIVMSTVIPKIEEIIRETTNNPPFFTKVMLVFYDFLGNYGWMILLAFFWLVVFFVYYFKTKEGKKRYDQLSLRTPLLGKILQKIFLIRFAENISTLISAGLSINVALRITEDTMGNFIYKKIVAETEKGVSEGEKISSILVKYPESIPSFVVQMIKVGEETGKLDKTLMEIVNFYGKEVRDAINTLTTLLEPILIIFLGIMVALLAVSVLEPLYGALGTI